MKNNTWYLVENIEKIDSPALLIYLAQMKSNLQSALHISGDASRLRPHVKTSKIAEVCTLMMQEGVQKFKCATIAEAEMLAMIGAPDVLLAYQPSGPKLQRFISLVKKYPGTYFSCLVDNEESIAKFSEAALADNIVLPVYIDVNIGMNRTGILPEDALALAELIIQHPSLNLEGIHAYDGHIHDTDMHNRKHKSDFAMEAIFNLQEEIENRLDIKCKIIAGGTPTYTIHASRTGVECSPGTFIFWDYGYSTELPDLPFQHAAVVITRVVSIVDAQTICVDLGHKSIAAEMPFPRVHFLNAPDAIARSHSEEHLTLTVRDSSEFKVGDVLYGVPMHICPTVALHERVHVVDNGLVTAEWQTIARDRRITV